jgi:hypothetical protein
MVSHVNPAYHPIPTITQGGGSHQSPLGGAVDGVQRDEQRGQLGQQQPQAEHLERAAALEADADAVAAGRTAWSVRAIQR